MSLPLRVETPTRCGSPGPWGTALAGLRKRHGLTRGTVAALAGMTPTTYGRIERGQHTQTQQLEKLADVFGVPLETVLGVHAAERQQAQLVALEREVRRLRARLARR